MTEALQKLAGDAKFDDVAREFSEDKARAGVYFFLYTYMLAFPQVRFKVRKVLSIRS